MCQAVAAAAAWDGLASAYRRAATRRASGLFGAAADRRRWRAWRASSSRIVADLQEARARLVESRGSQLALGDRRARRQARDARCAAAMAEAGALYLPERLHAVRIAVKKLRYAVELSTEAAGETRRRGPARAEARPGAARPAARCADADRSGAPDAGVADAAERDRVARARCARRLARGRLPAAARALHAHARRARPRSSNAAATRRTAHAGRAQARRAG